jgi:hypothetical protein
VGATVTRRFGAAVLLKEKDNIKKILRRGHRLFDQSFGDWILSMPDLFEKKITQRSLPT